MESTVEWIIYLGRQISAFTAIFHLTYLRLQSSKVIKCVLSFWKVGNSINIKQTTRLLILEHVPKLIFRLGSQRNMNDYFFPNLFGTGLIPSNFWLRSVLISWAVQCSSSYLACPCILCLTVTALPGRNHHPVLSKVHLTCLESG